MLNFSVLVFNAGSSSLKFALYETKVAGDMRLVIRGVVSHIGAMASLYWNDGTTGAHIIVEAKNHQQAAEWVLDWLQHLWPFGSLLERLMLVAHRVVHGGTFFYNPVVITEQVMAKLDSLTPLAPLHNPQAISVIRATQEKLHEKLLMLAVFDTAFFQDLPQYSGYALPESFSHAHGIKRFGFHGLAHQFMMQRFHQLHPRQHSHHDIISFQLGHGCSVTAISDGKPLDTSMGFTPLEGLVMATRAGDIDPGILIYLLKNGHQLDELEQKLNHHSGLLGLSKSSDDMRELLAREVYDVDAKLAVDMFCYRARKYLGAYMAVLGGADAVLFGGGIGENSPEIRKRICADMHWCGLQLDDARNQQATSVTNATLISSDSSSISVYVIAVSEEAVIAEEARAVLMSYPENLI